MAVIVEVVVVGLVVVCIVVAVVCVVQHHKSNQVVRMVQASTHSRGDTANITILHMSSNNPYERAPDPPPPPPAMLTSTTAGLNHPSLTPPDVPIRGFQPPGAQGQIFSTPVSMHPKDPAFPSAGGRPLVGGSSGINAMAPPPPPPPSMMNGPPGTIGGWEGAGGSGMAPPPSASSLNGSPALFRRPTMNGAAGGMLSASALPKISGTPRKVPPLPAISSAGVGGGPAPMSKGHSSMGGGGHR